MKVQHDSGWMRRGFSLLWDGEALARVATPGDVCSLRQFFEIEGVWPEELPSGGGNALVVAGVEGALDSLSDKDGATWLETDLKRAILSFQDEYEGQAALILWLPSGRRRVHMAPATEEYFWKTKSSKQAPEIPIGRCLWAGAESDVARIYLAEEGQPSTGDMAYVGLNHPRIS